MHRSPYRPATLVALALTLTACIDSSVLPDLGPPGDRDVDPPREENAIAATPDDGGAATPDDGGEQTPDDGGEQTPDDGGAPTPDDGSPPDPPPDDLGEACARPAGCDGSAPDWPDCLHADCATGRCFYPGAQSRHGYCTRPCTRDDECDGAVAGPYGDQFSCLRAGDDGRCAPGSAAICDLTRDPPCDDDDEICRWAGYRPGFGPPATCQPPTPDGRAIGEACDDAAGLHCAHDLCFFDTCTTVCDPAVPPEAQPCPDGWGCVDDFDIGIPLDLCLPPYCETTADCAPGHTCELAYDYHDDTVLRGVCTRRDAAEAQPGEACSPERPCQGATCLDDDDEPGYCAGLCDDDDDCGEGAHCAVVPFSIPGGTAPAQICRPGALTGSGRPCAIDGDCRPVDGEPGVPQESCEYIITGELEAGRYVAPPALVGRCAAIPPGAVGFGEACDDDAPCRTESLCLRAGQQPFCSATCYDSGHCDGGICFAIDFGGLRGGVCVPPAQLGAAGSSVDPCLGDCPNADETCQLNVIDAENPAAELICLTGGGDGEPGSPCVTADDCASNDCQPLSNDPDTPGYCRGVCFDDADCAAGGPFTCESVRPIPGAYRFGLCRPTDTCLPCTFDATRPCGGEPRCSLVDYGERGAGGVCLAPCPEGACPVGYTCRPARDADGRATDPDVCTPDDPAESCPEATPP